MVNRFGTPSTSAAGPSRRAAALLRAGIAVLLVVNAYWLWTGVPASAPRVPLRTALNSSISCYPNVCGCSGASRPRLTIAGFTKAWSAHSYGGLGKHADNLYRSLAERGHTVHVFTTAVRPVRAIDVEVGGRLVIHYCPFGDPGNGADQRFMLWTREAYDAVVPTLAQKAFDVIHLESAPIHLPSFANVTIPIVPSWHGVMLDVVRENAMQALLKHTLSNNDTLASLALLSKYLVSQMARFQTHFPLQVVLTERARLDLIRTYNIPAERVVVVHHSMPTESFVRSPSDGAAFRREHGVPEGPAVIVLGYASVLQEAKGLAMLLEAIPNMLALSPRLWILLAGGGTPDVMDRVNAVASSPACGGRLILLGPLTSARMPSFYSAIDVFIDTSLHHTGSNGVLVEAALSGAVLIAPEVGSNRMTNIPDRAMGYTYPPGDARHLVECVRRVLDTPNVLAEVPPLARAHALAGFSLLDMVDRYEALLFHAVDAGYTMQFPWGKPARP